MPSKTAAVASRLRQMDLGQAQSLFGSLVPFQAQPAQGARRRLFVLERTFWLFLYQVLSGNISCSEIVQKALAEWARTGAPGASANTAAYCKARQRLPQRALEETFQAGSRLTEALAPDDRVWCGRRVKIVDGSSVSMPDTPANQRRFPQPARQKKGCGFPVMRLVVLFSLSTGAMLSAVRGALTVHERELFHQLWRTLRAGDVVLADRGFCGLGDFWVLLQRRIDCVMRKHQRRSTGQRRLRRLGKGDWLVTWQKTGICPKWLERETWKRIGQELLVREIDIRVDIPGFRTQCITVATTLLDPRRFPAKAFAELYRRRWLAELFLRDIKISLRMDVLKCKTPEGVIKELTVYAIAYNLIRAIMLQSARRTATDPLRLSFKRTADALRQWLPIINAQDDPPQRQRLLERMTKSIAQLRLPNRPNRSEPRALKRRKKNYQLLNKPRNSFREIPHRNKYNVALS